MDNKTDIANIGPTAELSGIYHVPLAVIHVLTPCEITNGKWDIDCIRIYDVFSWGRCIIRVQMVNVVRRFKQRPFYDESQVTV